MAEKSPWVLEAEAGWKRELPRLKDQRYTVELTCFATPVQLEGALDTGESFYFRCRHEHCELLIAKPGSDPLEEPHWQREIQWGNAPEAASYISPADAVRTLLRLVTDYRKEGKGS